MPRTVEAKQWKAGKLLHCYFELCCSVPFAQFTSSAQIEQCPKANAAKEDGICGLSGKGSK